MRLAGQLMENGSFNELYSVPILVLFTTSSGEKGAVENTFQNHEQSQLKQQLQGGPEKSNRSLE